MKKSFLILSILNIYSFILISSKPSIKLKEDNNMIFHKNIFKLTEENENFRKVLKTATHSQIVLMSLKPNEDIGNEVHKDIDQILIFVKGNGVARISGKEYTISAGDVFLVPAGTEHNFTNTSKENLKLFTIYAPAEFETEITQKEKN